MLEITIGAGNRELQRPAVGGGKFRQVELPWWRFEVPLGLVTVGIEIDVLNFVGAVEVAVEHAPSESLPGWHCGVDVARNSPGVRATYEGGSRDLLRGAAEGDLARL